MAIFRISKKEFSQTFLGLSLTSFYGYLPHFSFLYLLIKHYNKLRFNKFLLNYTFTLVVILFLSYLFTFNLNILRILGLVLISFFFFSLFEILISKYEKIILKLPDVLFYIHGLVAILSFFSPNLNALLSGVKGTTGRISGLVGFDYMAFFCCTYLITCYLYSNRKINYVFLIKLFFSFLFVTLSGRFGITIIIYIILYIYFENISIKKSFLFLILVLTSLVLLKEQILFIYGTFSGFWSFLLDNTNTDLINFSEQYSNDDGYYSASPITWFYMFSKPFLNIMSYVFPSSDPIIVDPGPSNMILNLGLILTFIVYHYFSLFFRVNGSVNWPLLIIYLLSDIKFHGILVPSCMFWLLININKLKINESLK